MFVLQLKHVKFRASSLIRFFWPAVSPSSRRVLLGLPALLDEEDIVGSEALIKHGGGEAGAVMGERVGEAARAIAGLLPDAEGAVDAGDGGAVGEASAIEPKLPRRIRYASSGFRFRLKLFWF